MEELLEQKNIAIEDYAKYWDSIELQRNQYSYGQKNFMKIMLMCSTVKIKQAGWDYWIGRLGSVDKLERKFLNALVKYRTNIRKAILMNSIELKIQNLETAEIV